MKIKSICDKSFIEITFYCDNRDAPQCIDDLAINVELFSDDGFSGKCSEVWFRRSVLDDFLHDLKIFELTRRNSVMLSAWPEIELNPFELKLSAIDAGQTMFVEIKLLKNAYAPDGRFVPFRVSAHFVFDPSMLLVIVSEFEDLFRTK
ncbi:MAG: hypothetical protein JXA42_09030 [Anaerolineales bacterium]|nr:hypothetical protein [Anaerolineales bacterium]